MRKPFEEALDELLAQYRDVPADDLISALEIQIMRLEEDREDD